MRGLGLERGARGLLFLGSLMLAGCLFGGGRDDRRGDQSDAGLELEQGFGRGEARSGDGLEGQTGARWRVLGFD